MPAIFQNFGVCKAAKSQAKFRSFDMMTLFRNIAMELLNKVLYQIDLSHVEHRSWNLFEPEYFIFLTAFLYSK